MPFPNYHAARVSKPLPQGSTIFATKNIAPGIDIIIQRPKSGGSMQTQSYRFGKHQYTPEEAKSWLKQHKISYMSFEPATTGKEESKKETISNITKELSKAII